MNNAIAQLGDLTSEWAKNSHIPEVGWARVRALEFQELLNRRNTLVKRLEGSACALCKEFGPHVCPSAIFNGSASNIYV